MRPVRADVVAALLTLALLGGGGGSSAIAAPDRGPIRARYDLALAFEQPGVLAGTQRVSFVNAGPRPRRRVWLRLWANGPGGCGRPRIRVRVVAGGTAGPLSVGCTALPIELDRPVGVGRRTSVRLAVRIVAPRVARRFGRSGGAALYGNALPILAVERGSGPDLDPYIGLGDPFFSLTSEWTARLDVPAGWSAATTGRTMRRRALAGGARRLTIRAPRARDFALAIGRYRVSSTSVDGVRVRYLAAPGASRRRGARMLATAAGAVRAFSRRYGPYRASELDVVETPRLASEGMEYPELVMSEPVADTVVHEVAHQWWYSQVGSDGWRSPWLDETLTTYSQLRLIGGLGRCDLARPFADDGAARLTWSLGRFARSPADYPAVYDGGACALESLRVAWGTTRVQRMLRRYSERHLYGVATTDDLVAAIAEAAPRGFDGPAFLAYARIDARWPGP